jgi:transcription antitermination factor NusG
MSLAQVKQLDVMRGGTPHAITPASIVELHAPEAECGVWHVLHTRSRQEKALARTLDAAGLHCYLPLVDQVRFHGHRKKTVSLPLFSTYVFMHGTVEATYTAISTGRVANVIPVPDQAGFDHDLKQIRLALSGGATLQPTDCLSIGRRVRVTAGPFKDIEGLIEDRPRLDRLILQIDTLGRAASLEIDASLLQPVD